MISEKLTIVGEMVAGAVDGQTRIAEAITAKGVDTPTDSAWDTMARNIGLIAAGVTPTLTTITTGDQINQALAKLKFVPRSPNEIIIYVVNGLHAPSSGTQTVKVLACAIQEGELLSTGWQCYFSGKVPPSNPGSRMLGGATTYNITTSTTTSDGKYDTDGKFYLYPSTNRGYCGIGNGVAVYEIPLLID